MPAVQGTPLQHCPAPVQTPWGATQHTPPVQVPLQHSGPAPHIAPFGFLQTPPQQVCPDGQQTPLQHWAGAQHVVPPQQD